MWLWEAKQGSWPVDVPSSPHSLHLTRCPALERFPWQGVRLQPALHLQDQRGEHPLVTPRALTSVGGLGTGLLSWHVGFWELTPLFPCSSR